VWHFTQIAYVPRSNGGEMWISGHDNTMSADPPY
jgi:hypothetical protein